MKKKLRTHLEKKLRFLTKKFLFVERFSLYIKGTRKNAFIQALKVHFSTANHCNMINVVKISDCQVQNERAKIIKVIRKNVIR